jgi:nucleoside-diphosphate-sugar epimerase
VKYLVTGGAGFIGSNIVERLLADGHTVRVLDNFSTGRRENLEPFGEDVEVVEGDLLSYERVHNAVKGCDYVFHMGALPSVPRSVQDPLTSSTVNIIGTLNVLLPARDESVKRVVYAASSSAYGANPELPKREALTPMPISPYAVSKLAGEHFCAAFTSVYGLETVALRFFNVFGPRQNPSSQYSAVIPKFISALLDDDELTVFGDGTQSRDFTFVYDVVDAVLAASVAPEAAGNMFNTACGRRHTLLSLIEILERLTDATARVRFLDTRAGDVPHSMADVSAAAGTLGWTAKWSFEDGLARTVDALRLERERLGEKRP